MIKMSSGPQYIVMSKYKMEVFCPKLVILCLNPNFVIEGIEKIIERFKCLKYFLPGLFQGVIQQSGSPFAEWALTRRQRRPDFYYKYFATALGCAANTTRAIKHCLKSLPSDKIERLIFEKLQVGK